MDGRRLDPRAEPAPLDAGPCGGPHAPEADQAGPGPVGAVDGVLIVLAY
jgi:hypothetical protein